MGLPAPCRLGSAVANWVVSCGCFSALLAAPHVRQSSQEHLQVLFSAYIALLWSLFSCSGLIFGPPLACPGLVLVRPMPGSVRRLLLPLDRCHLHHHWIVDELAAVAVHICLDILYGGDLVALGGLPGAAALPVEARSPGDLCHPEGMGGKVWSR